MGAVIAWHDALLKEAIEATGGRITNHNGDGVKAEAAFEEVPAAHPTDF